MKEKSIIIIGAGIAGLSAGCYAAMSGYRSMIYETHTSPGGLCTSWKRGGYTIDFCLQWLVGSKPGFSLYRVWEELGAVQGRQFINADEFLRYEARDGRVFRLYCSVDRLEQHMLELAPEDAAQIRNFCNAIRELRSLGMPVLKPSALMSAWERMSLVVRLRKYRPFVTWNGMMMRELISRFTNPVIPITSGARC